MSPIDLSSLNHAQKDALILSLLAQVEALTKRVKELEAKLKEPPKTPNNSSLPPSLGQKASSGSYQSKPRRPHKGSARALHPNPTRTVTQRTDICPHCAADVRDVEQVVVHAYDRIEVPEVLLDVTRVVLLGGTCACCKKRYKASPPTNLAPGSPFGEKLRAMIVYLRMTHAVSIERLKALCRDLLGFDISEGALIDILKHAAAPAAQTVETIKADLFAGDCLASDETGLRIGKKKAWLWLFHHANSAVFVSALSRGKDVVEGFLGEHRFDYWLSDRLGSQMGWARKGQQVCLAHLIRDAQYAIDNGDRVFAPGLRKLFEDACAIGRRRKTLKDATLRHHHRKLEDRLDRLLLRAPSCEVARKLQRAILRHRQHLWVFLEHRAIEPTNNGSERALRPAATFRKVTNCFRTGWGAKLYADIRSVIETARRNGISALHAISRALRGEPLHTTA